MKLQEGATLSELIYSCPVFALATTFLVRYQGIPGSFVPPAKNASDSCRVLPAAGWARAPERRHVNMAAYFRKLPRRENVLRRGLYLCIVNRAMLFCM